MRQSRTSSCAEARFLPVSAWTMSISSSRPRITCVAKRESTAARSLALRSAHATCAARARSTAVSTSAAVPTGISARGSPVKTSLSTADSRLDGSARNSGIATRARRRSETSGAGRVIQPRLPAGSPLRKVDPDATSGTRVLAVRDVEPMSNRTGLTVGEVADLVGITVRTLHHWDRIGLVTASGRTWADYRVYDDDDVARIHRVLVYRELGF